MPTCTDTHLSMSFYHGFPTHTSLHLAMSTLPGEPVQGSPELFVVDADKLLPLVGIPREDQTVGTVQKPS